MRPFRTTMLLLAATGLACAGSSSPETHGILAGDWTDADGAQQTVTLSWTAEEPGHGSLRTTLGPGGEQFEGHFARVIEEDGFAPERHRLALSAIHSEWLADRWASYTWGDTAYVDVIGYPDFARRYSGRIVASLLGDRGHAIRCELWLEDPSQPLLQGGSGHCQVSDGGTIELHY